VCSIVSLDAAMRTCYPSVMKEVCNMIRCIIIC